MNDSTKTTSKGQADETSKTDKSERKKMGRQNFERIPPVPCPNVITLSREVGSDKAAHLLGVAVSTLANYRSKQTAPKSVEKAATFELEKRGNIEPTGNSRALVPANELLLLRCTPDKVDLLMTFLKGAEIRAIRIKE